MAQAAGTFGTLEYFRSLRGKSSKIEIQDMSGKVIFTFQYNPSQVSYSVENQYYQTLFLQSSRSVQEFLRSGKVSISGSGKFVSTERRTAKSQFLEFLDTMKIGDSKSSYFILHNPVLNDSRTVVFKTVSMEAASDMQTVPFSFTAIETDIISEKEKDARFTAYNTNNAKYITPKSIADIEKNIAKYIDSGHSVEEARVWGLKGKIPGSAEFLLVDGYCTFRRDAPSDDNAENIYNNLKYDILEENNRIAALYGVDTNSMEELSESGDTRTEYIVRSGDTLGKIAYMFYKSSSKSSWWSIYLDNIETIERAAILRGKQSSGNGMWIFPGTKLSIANALTTSPTKIVHKTAVGSVIDSVSDVMSHSWRKIALVSELAVGAVTKTANFGYILAELKKESKDNPFINKIIIK